MSLKVCTHAFSLNEFFSTNGLYKQILGLSTLKQQGSHHTLRLLTPFFPAASTVPAPSVFGGRSLKPVFNELLRVGVHGLRKG